MGFNYRMPELVCAAVALAQLERIEELVNLRVQVAELFAKAVEGCHWLTPQFVPPGYIHSYWTYVLRLGERGEFNWYDFRNKFKELGGDGVYAAWQLTYLEPVFRKMRLHPNQRQDFERGLCPVAESLQPRLFQFKTNYFDMKRAKAQADVLSERSSILRRHLNLVRWPSREARGRNNPRRNRRRTGMLPSSPHGGPRISGISGLPGAAPQNWKASLTPVSMASAGR